MPRYYLTTAIDYANGDPHMGHAYEKVVADFYARASRIRGIDTRFLIGLDEHTACILDLKSQEARATEPTARKATTAKKSRHWPSASPARKSWL